MEVGEYRVQRDRTSIVMKKVRTCIYEIAFSNCCKSFYKFFICVIKISLNASCQPSQKNKKTKNKQTKEKWFPHFESHLDADIDYFSLLF